MAYINVKSRHIYCKIVYYGPAGVGKSTNICYIHRSLPCSGVGGIYCPQIGGVSGIVLDISPKKEFINIEGFAITFRVNTISGAVIYQDHLVKMLDGVDGVVFVAHSQERFSRLNLEVFQSLSVNIAQKPKTFWQSVAQIFRQKTPVAVSHRSIERIPVVIQYNKRDLPDILPIPTLNAQLQTEHCPHHAAIAAKGSGVLETFQDICNLVVARL